MGVEGRQVGVDDAGRGGLAVAYGDDVGGMYTFDQDIYLTRLIPPLCLLTKLLSRDSSSSRVAGFAQHR